MSNTLTNLNLSDKGERFGFEPESAPKAAKSRMPPHRDGRPDRKCRVYEMPVGYNGRDDREGEKIGWKDGIEAL